MDTEWVTIKEGDKEFEIEQVDFNYFVKTLSKDEKWTVALIDKDSCFNYLMTIPDLFIRSNIDGKDKECSHNDQSTERSILSTPTLSLFKSHFGAD